MNKILFILVLLTFLIGGTASPVATAKAYVAEFLLIKVEVTNRGCQVLEVRYSRLVAEVE